MRPNCNTKRSRSPIHLSRLQKNIVEPILLFVLFYLPGYLWPQAEVVQDGGAFGFYMLQFLLISLPQILLLLYLLNLRSGDDGHQYSDFGLLRLRTADLLQALFIFAGIFVLLIVLGLILSLIPAADRSFLSSGFRWKLDNPRLIPLVLVFCLVVGYREELFFRSYLLTRLSHLHIPPAVCIGMSTLLFAAGHAYQGVAGLIVALIQGLYFAILFLRLKNIHPLAIAHALYNASVLVVSMFTDTGLPMNP